MTKRLLLAATAGAAAFLAACSGSSTQFVAAPTTAGVNTFTFCSSSSNPTAGTTSCPTAAPATTDDVGGGFWNSVDVYYPAATVTRAVIFLHGAGGYNYGIAYDLGLNSQDAPAQTANINFDWLTANSIIAVFPQGRGDLSSGGTWSNRVMTSGQDDLSMVQALASYVKTTYGVSNVYLVGHSNGGMMANRVWCEAGSPNPFAGYVALAGSPSEYYLANACSPADIKPYSGIVGDSDTVICDNGNATDYGIENPVSGCDGSASWTSPTWTINSTYESGVDASAFVDPTLINEAVAQNSRAQTLCGESLASSPTSTTGNNAIWTNCSGKLKLQEVIGANHPLSSGHGLLCATGGNNDGNQCSIQTVSTGDGPGSTGLLDEWIMPFINSLGG